MDPSYFPDKFMLGSLFHLNLAAAAWRGLCNAYFFYFLNNWVESKLKLENPCSACPTETINSRQNVLM
jgi:hypothetical protein